MQADVAGDRGRVGCELHHNWPKPQVYCMRDPHCPPPELSTPKVTVVLPVTRIPHQPIPLSKDANLGAPLLSGIG